MNPVVMVSSVITGLEQYRTAAAAAIREVGAMPLLVNEMGQAGTDSSRNRCLDAVRACDVFLLIIGPRGGSVAPSGETVVEEEFHEAKRLGKRILAFVLPQPPTDENAERLRHEAESYVEGYFRKEVDSPESLQRSAEASLREYMTRHQLPENGIVEFEGLTKELPKIEEPFVCLKLLPVRKDEVITSTMLVSQEWLEEIADLCMSRTARVCEAHHQTSWRAEPRAMIVDSLQSGHFAELQAQVRVGEDGHMLICKAIDRKLPTEQGHQIDQFFRHMIIDTEDVDAAMHQVISCANAILTKIDPYFRLSELLFTLELHGLADKALERDPQPRSSFQLLSRPRSQVLLSDQTPRKLTRDGLRQIGDIVGRASASFLLQAGSP